MDKETATATVLKMGLATGSASPEANREVFHFAPEPGTWTLGRYMLNAAS
jgi:hypothetical protein